MDDLIKALQIFRKYGNPNYPTHCEHDVLYVSIEPETVSEDDKDELEKLGFYPENEYGMFRSYQFGSS